MRIVVALGGNALGYTPEGQIKNARLTASLLKDLILEHDVILTHGNGPQVGLINLAFSEGKKINPKVVDMPFSEEGAMSQGYIGYHLANTFTNILEGKKEVCNILTQVVVAEDDPAFLNPTKPIGSFYTYDEIKDLPQTFKEDSGRGYRMYVASPTPKEVVEIKIIKKLVSTGALVICGGGGGIPVIKKNGLIKGIDAVIDKDMTSALIAKLVDADMLIILTSVKNAKINFRQENETDLGKISASLIRVYLENGEFKEGSMLPKIKACLNFLDCKKDCVAVVTDIDNVKEAIKLQAGTIIYNKE